VGPHSEDNYELLLQAEERREEGTWGEATLIDVAQEKVAAASMERLAESVGCFFDPNPTTSVLDIDRAWLPKQSLYYEMLEGTQGHVAITRAWAVDTVQSGMRYFLVRRKYKRHLTQKEEAEALALRAAVTVIDEGSSGWYGPGTPFTEHVEKPWLSEAGWGAVKTPRGFREELQANEAEKQDMFWRTPRQVSKRLVNDTKERRISCSGRVVGGSFIRSSIGTKKKPPPSTATTTFTRISTSPKRRGGVAMSQRSPVALNMKRGRRPRSKEAWGV
jgi:hypothetical protein